MIPTGICLFLAALSLNVAMHGLSLVATSRCNSLLWHTGLVALQHMGSSRTRDRTCVPCIGGRIPNH